MRSNPFFQVYARPNGLDVARLGLVVGKKVAKQAVRRNFIKRSIRETFRLNHDRLIGFDFVVRSRIAFNRQQSHEARRALIALFAKLASCRASSSR